MKKDSTPTPKPDRETRLQKLDEKIEDAIENKSAVEVRDAYIDKAELFREEENWTQFRANMELALTKVAGASKKLELKMEILQSYHVERNEEKFKELLAECHSLEEEGGDWEKRNKMNLYKALQNIKKRNFEEAARLLLSTVSTFNSADVMSYSKLVFYATILSVLSLSRAEIKEKVVEKSEVTTELMQDETTRNFLEAFYRCKYAEFFPRLLVLSKLIQEDEFLRAHQKFILRRSRIVIYSQFLESYKTVTLKNMASSFGVSEEFIDSELSHLIAAKKLNCKIDKLEGVVNIQKSDSRVTMYDEILRKGDTLVEKMHKLARIAQA